MNVCCVLLTGRELNARMREKHEEAAMRIFASRNNSHRRIYDEVSGGVAIVEAVQLVVVILVVVVAVVVVVVVMSQC